MTNSKHVPKRRFKEFELDSEWELKKLGDFGSVEMCKRIFKNETSDKFDIPFYKIGTFGKQADSYISREKFESYKNSFPYPKKGDLLLSASGSIGNVVEYRGEDAYFQDSNIVWLNHSGKINNTFLKQFYSIASWEGIEGTTIKRLYNKNILETKISLPSMHEQKQIGKFFQTIDSLISLHQHKLDKLKDLKKAYLTEMFPAEGERVPKRRFPGFEGEWEQKKLGQLMDVGSVKRVHQSDWRDRGVRFLRARDIVSESKNKRPDDFLYIDEELYKKYSAISGVVEKGDLLVTGVGTIGVPMLVESSEPLYFKDGNIIWFKNKNLLDGHFFYYSFTARAIQKFIGDVAGVGTVGTYTIDSGKNTPILLPVTKEEQVVIGDFFKKLDQSVTLQQHKLDKLNDLKKAYLNELFV